MKDCRLITEDSEDTLNTPDSVKILVVGDLHFAPRSKFLLSELKEKLLSSIEKYRPDMIVWLGDTLDRFGTVTTSYSEDVIEFLKSTTVYSPSVLLIGNHDIPNKTYFMSSQHAFTGVKYWDKIRVVDTQCYEFKIKDLIFQAVPYCPNGRFREGLETLKDKCLSPRAIFCHQEMKGCNKDGKGMISIDGDDWGLDEPLCICGHIHKDHSPQPNIEYVGSPYQDNFGEDTDKSISLYSFTEKTYKRRRIYLNLPIKEKRSMTSKKYKRFTPENHVIYWITVKGSATKNSVLEELEKTREIRKKGGKVIFITDSEYRNEEIEFESRPLRQVIAESISKSDNKKELRSIYDEVFG